MITLRFTPGIMYLMIMLKMLSGYLFIRQAKQAFKIFKGIVKEYRNAELGLTNGIQMVNRKSKEIKSHKSFVKKITLAQILIYMVACIMLKNEFIAAGNYVIRQQHAHDDDLPRPMSYFDTYGQ